MATFKKVAPLIGGSILAESEHASTRPFKVEYPFTRYLSDAVN